MSKKFLSELKEFLQKKKNKKLTLELLSNSLDVSVKRIRDGITELRNQGMNIHIFDDTISLTTDIPKTAPLLIDVGELDKGKVYRFGAISDTHLASKYERLDALRAYYKILEKEGVTTVYHAGNIVDGEARFNRYDLKVHGLEGQVQYLVNNYPKHDSITTYFVTGDDHEGWWVQREGVNIGQYIENAFKARGLTNFIHLGYMEHDIHLKAKKGKTVLRVLHPGGGSAYAISYTVQKIVESYQGGEKPQILLAGHYHKAEYLYLRNVHIIQTASFQDQTPFMRKKKIASHVGGWIIEFTQGRDGTVRNFKSHFIPFFDRNYYTKKWKHKGLK